MAISGAAATAREQARRPDGTFGEQTHGVQDAELCAKAPLSEEGMATRLAALKAFGLVMGPGVRVGLREHDGQVTFTSAHVASSADWDRDIRTPRFSAPADAAAEAFEGHLDEYGRLDMDSLRDWAAQNVEPTDEHLTSLMDSSDGHLRRVHRHGMSQLPTQEAKLFLTESLLSDQERFAGTAVVASLSARGYVFSDIERFERAGIERPSMIYFYDKDRAESIASSPVLLAEHVRSPGGISREALLELPVEKLREISAMPHEQQHDALVRSVDPEVADRHLKARELGIEDQELIEHTRVDLARAVPLQKLFPKQGGFDIAAMVDNGYDAASAKKWGSRIATKFSVQDMEKSGMSPAQARSLLAVTGSLSEATEWHKAGFDDGLDVIAWRPVMPSGKISIAELGKIRRVGLPPETVRHWISGLPILKPTAKDFRAVKKVATRYPNPLAMRDHIKAIESRPDIDVWTKDRVRIIASLGQMEKADVDRLAPTGLPLHRLHEFVGETHPWEAGAPYRTAWEERTGRAWPLSPHS